MTKPEKRKKVNGVRHRMGVRRPFHKSMTGHHRSGVRVASVMYASVREAFDAARERRVT